MFASLFGRALVAGAIVGALTVTTLAQDAGSGNRTRSTGPGVTVRVRGNVDQTVAGLKKMVANNGMMVMGELHQGKVLEMTGLKVKSETIFVGNPNVGKQLFSQEPGAGLVLPIRINIYQDARGQTYVRYIPPSHELDGFGNPQVTQIAKMLDGKLQNLTAMLR